MSEFKIDIKGRVRNFSLPEKKALMPLFEAVVNSIHAINERKKNKQFDGYVKIIIERETTISSEIDGCIENIVIEDNGIGFNDDNYKSFLTSDSSYKEGLGGKGVGRFSWLKTFDYVSIDSTYEDGDDIKNRKFEFSLANQSVNDSLSIMADKENLTKISLHSYKDKYRKNAPILLDKIALKIFQHCFVFFLEPECPRIELTDGDKTIDLNSFFNEKVKKYEKADTITIAEEEFELELFEVDRTLIQKHKLYFCANNRLVDSHDLNKLITNLDSPISEDKIWLLGIVTSKYFDNNVDMNRLSFTIPENADDGILPIVTIGKIIEEVTFIIENYFKEYLMPIAEAKMQRISSYVTTRAPQYRHILKYMPDEIEKIKPSVTEDKLDAILYQLDRDFNIRNMKQGKELIETLKNDVTLIADYKEKFEEHVTRISDENKSILAKYVAHRKSIIDLFELGMNKQSDDKYCKEEFMHNLIYPMRKTSEDILYDQHNLWLVDERLSYFFFASSDISFNNDRKEERPDIMFFDKSIALLETKNDGTCYDNIVIFELKKPMRSDLATKNPVEQIIEYMLKIQTNAVKDKNGRLIKVDDHTKFYLYVVCDVLENYKTKLDKVNGFKETIDGLGMFRMQDNTYIEILTYDKIINDAKKRNKILFDKLGL